jgi:adenylate cyclase
VQSFLSRHRFQALSLGISVLLIGLLLWADHAPPIGFVDKRSHFLGNIATAVRVAELRATDFHFRFRGPLPPHPDVRVVAIDERSVQRYGRWIWPRELVAEGLEKIQQAGAKAIGLDMMFVDEDRSGASNAYRSALASLDQSLAGTPPELASQLAGYRASLVQKSAVSGDDQLASALALPRIVQGVVSYPAPEEGFAAREPQWDACLAPHLVTSFPARVPGSHYEVNWDDEIAVPHASAQAPLARFCTPSSRLGAFNVVPDPDGTLRRIAPFYRLAHPRGLLPSLALETAATYWDANIVPVWDPDQQRVAGAKLVRNGKVLREVPVDDEQPYTTLDPPGLHDVFKTISFGDVLEGRVDPAELKDKAVIVGVTLLGEFDQTVTPFGQTIEPGVYSQAAMLSNILSGDFLVRTAREKLIELFFMLATALLLGTLLPRAPFLFKALSMVGLGLGWIGFSHALFLHGVLLRGVLPVANVFAVGFGVIFLGYLTVDREKGKLKGAFGHYLSPRVMEQMLADPDKLKLGGEKREMTVLFSDVRGFTTLSERMSPEALVKFINSYLTPMTQIVLEEEGTLDKYIGDALMAFWGAPLEQPDHAMRACRSALRFLGKMEELRDAWRKQGLPEFDIGVGINSGPMIVGNMGSDVRFDYTVMGDAVNLASRLEGTNKDYGTRILLSEATYQQVKDSLCCRRLGAVRVKGKRKPVRIYELRSDRAAFGEEAELIKGFERAVDDFAAQRFDDASAGFRAVLQAWPNDGPSWTYLAEIKVLKEAPPGPNWDGVYGSNTK